MAWHVRCRSAERANGRHSPPLDVPRFRRALEELREGGLTIALDDVGLGQSNYKMILDVHPDICKLDR